MKKHLILAVALAIAVLAAGCGSSGGGGPARPGPGAPAAPSDDGADGHGDHGAASGVTDGARRIPVNSTSFAFQPRTVHARAGEPIAIALSSDDIVHDLRIDELGAHVATDRGVTTEGGIVAERPGRYTFYCSVPGHREAGMEGVLVVT